MSAVAWAQLGWLILAAALFVVGPVIGFLVLAVGSAVAEDQRAARDAARREDQP